MSMCHSPDYQTGFESMDLSVQEKFNIDFQDDGHLLLIYKLSWYFLTKFQINLSFGSGEEAQNRN